MTQVDSENSTAMHVASTRRRFLSQAAAVTAGGAALGMALPLPGSATTAEQARDPVYALIETHRAATEALNAVLR